MSKTDLVNDAIKSVVNNAGDAMGNAERAQYLFQHGDMPAVIEALKWAQQQAALIEKAAERALVTINSLVNNQTAAQADKNATQPAPSDAWNSLDQSARVNLSGNDLQEFFRYRDELRKQDHAWGGDAEEILTGYLWDASEDNHA